MQGPTPIILRRRMPRFVSTLTLIGLAACSSEGPDWRSLEPVAFGDDRLVFEWAPASDESEAAAVRVRLISADRESIIFVGSVANGGVDLDYGNLRPQADKPPEIVMCLNGSQQDDLHVRINTKVGTVIRSQRDCTQ